MRIIVTACTILVSIMGCASGDTRDQSEQVDVQVSDPIELRIDTDLSTKDEIAAEYGQPDREERIEEESPCSTRWLYDGEANLGFGLVDVAMFIEFDDESRVCSVE